MTSRGLHCLGDRQQQCLRFSKRSRVLVQRYPQVTCSRGVKIKADCKIAECEARDWDAVVCPGGMPGAVSLKENETLEAILRKQVRHILRTAIHGWPPAPTRRPMHCNKVARLPTVPPVPAAREAAQ